MHSNNRARRAWYPMAVVAFFTRLIGRASPLWRATRALLLAATTASLVWVGASLVGACEDQPGGTEGEAGRSAAPLIRDDATALLPTDAGVPACWMHLTAPGYDREKEWTRIAIENSWMKFSPVRFTGWNDCPDPTGADSTPMVKMVITNGEAPDGNPPFSNCGQTEGVGMQALWPANAPEVSDAGAWQESVIFCFSNAGTQSRDTVQGIVVHEFGHVLGYEHEQDQDAAWADPGNCAHANTPQNPYYTDILTPYDPDSIMNYCAAGRGIQGRVSELDIQGLQSDFYGPPTRTDSDGDGIPDWKDNCPYVANNAQIDSNWDAELQVQNDLGFTGSNEGKPPTGPTDPYVTRWHAAYKGDACDPVVSTYTSQSWGSSHIESSSNCYSQLIGGVGGKTLTDAGCPISFNTNLAHDSYFGGPAGLAPLRPGQSVPTFCLCPYAQDPTNASLCQGSPYNCLIARDDASPYNPSPPSSGWRKISQEQQTCIIFPPNPPSCWYSHTGPYAPVPTTHLDPMSWIDDAGTTTSTWDFLQDLQSFGYASPYDASPDPYDTDAAANNMVGSLWTQVRQFTYPIANMDNPDGGAPCLAYDGGPAACTNNLQDTYAPLMATWDWGVKYTIVPYFHNKWMPIPYCDPNPFKRVEWNILPFMTVDNASGQTYVYAQGNNGLLDGTYEFSSAGLGLATTIPQGTGELLLADDRVGGQAPTDVGPSAIVVVPGTSQLVGAFTLTKGKIDAVSATSQQTPQAAVRSYAAGAGMLYWLQNSGGQWSVYALNVTLALQGQSSITSVSISGPPPVQPMGMAFNRVTQSLDVLDWIPGQTATEHLLQIAPTTGVSTELWRTALIPGSSVPSMYISTTLEGDIVVSQSNTQTNVTDVLWTSSAGRPLGSFSESGTLYSAALGTAAGLTLPMSQTPTQTQPNMRLDHQIRGALGVGVCNSPFWTKYGNHVVGSGALADGATCNPIGNGGFEVGSLMFWTASGASEAVSTAAAHSGSFGAVLGLGTPTAGDSTVKQTFTVPSGGGTLSFWWSNTCPDTVYYDWFTATLQNTAGTTLATIVSPTCTATPVWTNSTLDLSSWAGQTVVVVLTSHDDDYWADPTYSYVDDISLN